MTAIAQLQALASGARPANDALLGNARCEWRGVETLGEEALLAMFARQPFQPGGDVLTVETGHGGVWIGASEALVADLYDGRIGRLWRLGPGDAGEPERSVDLAFDPDMHQSRGALFFCREDHPTLEDDAVGPLRDALGDAIEGARAAGALRVRGFAIRALGDGNAAAALLALYSLGDGAVRESRLAYAAVAIARGRAAPIIVYDAPPPRAWSPRL